jgi:putative N6-adenine-specific DNA methylase
MQRYFATVARGLESVAAQELEALGARQVKPDFTGVHFTGDRALLYRVNLWARTLFRVLVPIAEFRCRHARELYQSIQNIDWREHLSPDQTLAVDCTGGNRQLNHTHFTALQVKNAIVDQQRAQTGRRSSIDLESPDLRLNLHIYQQRGTLSLDSSGQSFQRRGYRPAMGKAPLTASLAAAILPMTVWQPELPLYDPFCGSGTFLLEAALMARRIAPGSFRKEFAFERWRTFDAALWQSIQQEAQTVTRDTLPAPILGSDRDPEILQQAQSNAQNCDLGEQVQFFPAELSAIAPLTSPGILLCNPPHGQRLGEPTELLTVYAQLGDILKQRFQGWIAYILTTKPLSKAIGLRASERLPIYNGSLACTLLKYELY